MQNTRLLSTSLACLLLVGVFAAASGPPDGTINPSPVAPNGQAYTCHWDEDACDAVVLGSPGYITSDDVVAFHNDGPQHIEVTVRDTGSGIEHYKTCLAPGDYSDPDWSVDATTSTWPTTSPTTFQVSYNIAFYYGCGRPCPPQPPFGPCGPGGSGFIVNNLCLPDCGHTLPYQ